jgi:type IV secretory pathway VirB10-like protein
MSEALAFPAVTGKLRARSFLRWRMVSALAVAQFVVTVGVLGVDGPDDSPESFAVVPDEVPAEAPPAPQPPAPQPPAPQPPAPAPAAPAQRPGPPDEVLVATARAAIEAWGRFASTGQLAEVANAFVQEGPQYQQFVSEAPSRRTAALGPPYTFTMDNPVVLPDQPEGDRLVRADLELAREGSVPQVFQWDLRLRRGDDGVWRIWTVQESAGG